MPDDRPADDAKTLWPPSAAALGDTTRCPACFTKLGGIVCPHCDLRLDTPAAERLLELVRRMLADDRRRNALIDEIRVENLRVVEARRIDAERAEAARSSLARALEEPTAKDPAPRPTGPAPSAASLPAYRAAVPLAPVRRRSTVQVLLLATGVVLVSVTAVFFALIAFLFTSAEVRAGLLLGVSVGVFALAAALRRRLPGTAEGIAALAVALLALDGILVRTQGLFGSHAVPGWLFTGVFAGVVAGALLALRRVVPLRTFTLGALVLAPLATYGVGAGAGQLLSTATATGIWTGATLTGAVGLASGRALRSPAEVTWARFVVLAALVVSSVAGLAALPSVSAGGTVALLVTAALWLRLAVVDGARSTWLAGSAAGSAGTAARIGLGLTAVTAPLVLLARLPGSDSFAWSVPVITSLVAVALSVVRTATLRTAARTALVCTAITVSGDLLAAIVSITDRIGSWSSISAFSRTPFSTTWPAPGSVPVLADLQPWAPVAVAFAALLCIVSAGLVGGRRSRLRRRVTAVAAALIAAAAIAAALRPAAVAAETAGLAAIIAVAVVASRSRRLVPGELRWIAASTAVAASALVWVGAPSTRDLWPVGTVLGVVGVTLVRLGLRWLPMPRAPRDAAGVVLSLLGLGSVLAAVVRLPDWWLPGPTDDRLGFSALALTSLVALVLLAVAPVIPGLRRIPALDAGALAIGSLAALAVAVVDIAVAGFFVTDDGHPAAWATLFALVSAVAILWLLFPADGRGVARSLAAIVAPAAALGAAAGLAVALGWWFDVTLAAAVVVVSGASLVVLARRGSTRRATRTAWDATTALGGLATVGAATDAPHDWLVYLLLTVASIFVASGAGPILTGRAPRRHVAWIALPLATAALWTTLRDHDVATVEAYTLPIAGLLLLTVAALALWRPVDPRRVFDGRTTLFGASLAVGILPTLVASSEGPLVRPLLLVAAGIVAAALVAIAPAVIRGVTIRLPLLASALVAIGATSAYRSLIGPTTNDPDWARDALAVGGALLLLAAAVAVARRGRGRVAAATTAIVAIATFTVPMAAIVATDTENVGRAVGAVVGLGAASVVAAAVHPTSASRILRFLALACSALLAVVALLFVVGPAVPFEAVTVPVGLALLLGGALDLRRNGIIRSWPTLGPGLLVMLVPSLLADYVDVQLVRVVALGVVAVAVLLMGFRRHLQAPFVIGVVVVVLHALAQLWPGIRELSSNVPWWLWAGVGGVILIAVAATYERRIQQARSVARTVVSLR